MRQKVVHKNGLAIHLVSKSKRADMPAGKTILFPRMKSAVPLRAGHIDGEICIAGIGS